MKKANQMFRRHFILLIGISTIFFSGCKVQYSFTGASISPEVKTVSVDYFQNLASLVYPQLSSKFTEALKERFITQTSLNAVKEYGDLQFSGQITGYGVTPIAIQSNETAAQNRLTISIRVKFENVKDKTFNFDKTFTQYENFDSNLDFSSIEAEKVDLIITKLIDEIFNNSVANW